MKKTGILNSIAIAAFAVAFVGCNPLNKMSKEASNVTYSIDPNPLEMHGDSVALSISGKIPPNFFHKKAIVEVTPILNTASDAPEMIKEFKPIVLVGEEADGEGKKIAYASGGSFTYNDRIPYKKAMANATLDVKVAGKFKTKSKEFGSYKVGDGTITTPFMVQSDERPILGIDKFVKVTPRSVKAEINYLVNSSQVRSSELRDDDIKAVSDFINMGAEKGYVFKNMNVSAYASPDGEITLNENLANDRATSAKKAMERSFKKAKVELGEDFYKLEGKGEDWSGFKSAMQKSDIKDKELILRVLEMTSDLNKREKEIKNLSATYTEVADKILPGLRRSQLTINAEELSKSDEEITALIESNPDSLTSEELLYGATLTEDLDKKLTIYKIVKKNFTSDWRGANNAGYIYMLQNKTNDAKAEFDAAAAIDGNNPIIKNNQGIIARLNGDIAKAKDLYNAAKGAGSEVNYNLGIVNIIQGSYDKAVSNFGSEKSFNAGLAQMLNGDGEKALKTIDGSADKSMAESYYLKAVHGAKTKNVELMKTNLKTAFEKDSKLKLKAKKDVAFIQYWDNGEFKALF